jgi:hypothetical protein
MPQCTPTQHDSKIKEKEKNLNGVIFAYNLQIPSHILLFISILLIISNQCHVI